ncbi:MAG: lipoprotein signal peptidase [Bacteroidia bacterium]|nr:lipoprotein signal peptidase [Bacteroidia bacterium]NNF31712.1 lipoprotein signal peptidase [Flavobacteriaceae bacterium]NNJ81127.1 lipoprotein signal peptidase [Flavobacteriaceae bacterium]NNK55226.1 lipoprotein signal peptidase [Flavobacteriaceae bacterium]NNM10221.1 lipoprotein signal peptidase [Flavobacteriaceae bacterium]
MIHRRKMLYIGLLIAAVLIIDQALKFYVKTSFPLDGGFKMLGLDWAQIKFTENYGMAFGLELGGKAGKIILGVFRILAGSGLLYYTYKSLIQEKRFSFVVSLALITAGAIGNIIDGLFYGVIFSESTGNTTAEFLPKEGGYSTFFDGHVVDMFYFPIIETYWPDWVPFVGGELFKFNNYIFNFADLSITIGVVWIILLGAFSKKFSL